MTDDLHEDSHAPAELHVLDGDASARPRRAGSRFMEAIDALLTEQGGSNLPPEQVGYVRFWANEIATLRADLINSANHRLSARLNSADVAVLNDFQLAVDFWNKPTTAAALDFLLKVCSFPDAISVAHAQADTNRIIAAHPLFPMLHPVLQEAVLSQLRTVSDPLNRVSCHI